VAGRAPAPDMRESATQEAGYGFGV